MSWLSWWVASLNWLSHWYQPPKTPLCRTRHFSVSGLDNGPIRPKKFVEYLPFYLVQQIMSPANHVVSWIVSFSLTEKFLWLNLCLICRANRKSRESPWLWRGPCILMAEWMPLKYRWIDMLAQPVMYPKMETWLGVIGRSTTPVL